MKSIFKKACAAFFAAIFLLCGCAEKPNHLATGKDALFRGDFVSAEKEFELFIEEQEGLQVKSDADEEIKKANISEAYLGIGIARFEQKRYEEAEAAFSDTVKLLGANTPLICRFMGICRFRREEYKEALEYFAEGLRLPAPELKEGEDPEEYRQAVKEMRLLSIECYEKLRDFKNADKAARRYLEDYPGDEAVKKEADFLRTRVIESEWPH